MSKNSDRYKETHLEALDDDELLELETETFEKFAPKKSGQRDKKKSQKIKDEE